MENKKLSCLKVCSKNVRRERGEKKKQFGRAVMFLDKAKRFVLTDLGPLKAFGHDDDDHVPKSLMLPFPIISLEVTEAGHDPVFGIAGAMVVVARQIKEREVAICIFAKFEGSLSWKHAFVEVRVQLNDKDLLDIGYRETVKIDRTDLTPEFVEFNDKICRMAAVEVLAFIRFLEKYPERVELKEPVRNGKTSSQGKPLEVDSYRVLVMPTEIPEKSESLGGTHNSPRSHERRGFWRSSKYGVRHWVNATVVNPDAEHKVDKDYVIKPKPTTH